MIELVMCGFGPWLFPTSKFTIQNKCSYDVDPIIANTNCGYSPRELFRCIFFKKWERDLLPFCSWTEGLDRTAHHNDVDD